MLSNHASVREGRNSRLSGTEIDLLGFGRHIVDEDHDVVEVVRSQLSGNLDVGLNAAYVEDGRLQGTYQDIRSIEGGGQRHYGGSGNDGREIGAVKGGDGAGGERIL